MLVIRYLVVATTATKVRVTVKPVIEAQGGLEVLVIVMVGYRFPLRFIALSTLKVIKQ